MNNEKLNVIYCLTQHQVAGIFTKPLKKEVFEMLGAELGVISLGD